VYKFLENSEVKPFFALSWVLTWYSYGLDELDLVCRLYDFLMASHPLASLYLAAVIVCSLKEDLLNIPCEFSAVHTYLNNLQKDIPYEALIQEARRLLKKNTTRNIML